jgi:hypothetical protein
MTCGALGDTMTEIELSAGSILYEDSGGEGPVVVLCHGLLMTASLWDEVVEELGPGFRCVRPTLPLGAHPQPMRAEADRSLPGPGPPGRRAPGAAGAAGVTLLQPLVRAQLLIAEGRDARVGRLVPTAAR